MRSRSSITANSWIWWWSRAFSTATPAAALLGCVLNVIAEAVAGAGIAVHRLAVHELHRRRFVDAQGFLGVERQFIQQRRHAAARAQAEEARLRRVDRARWTV